MVYDPELVLWGENAVVAEIRRAGGFARNANVSIRPDYPKIDVIARLNGTRMLIQVRTTGWPDGNFITAPKDGHKVEDFAAERRAHGIWAFVHRVDGEATIRYAPAGKVTTLAEQWEAEYLLDHTRPPLYHTNIHEWDITIARIAELLNQPSRPTVCGADNRLRRRPREMHHPKQTEHMAERAARAALREAGCPVVNVNRAIGRDYPVIDLVARRGAARMLIQVRGTWTADAKFTATPAQSRALAALAASRGCHALWAFVHLTGDGKTVRFATAAQVTRLAEEDEATTPGINRYHVNIRQFEINASRIGELLTN